LKYKGFFVLPVGHLQTPGPTRGFRVADFLWCDQRDV
jgi:hypothetical protein